MGPGAPGARPVTVRRETDGVFGLAADMNIPQRCVRAGAPSRGLVVAGKHRAWYVNSPTSELAITDLVGPPADPVAWRIVVADSDLAPLRIPLLSCCPRRFACSARTRRYIRSKRKS